MPNEAQRTLKAFLAQLKKQIGPEIQAIVLFGSLARGDYISGRSNLNVMLLVTKVGRELLERCGRLQRRWGKEGIVAPLVFTEDELRSFLELFPLECIEIKEHHVLLHGPDPFSDLHINDRNLLVQCEQEIRGNLLRVRQRFVEGWGRPEAIQVLLSLSLTAVIPCIRGIFRLLGQSGAGTPQEILNRLAPTLKLDPAIFQEVLNMKRGLSSPGPIELPQLFERYLSGLELLVEGIHTLKTEGRL